MTARLEKDHFDVQLVVPDIDRALGFWRDTLGFEVDRQVRIMPGIVQCRLRAGSALIKLIEVDETVAGDAIRSFPALDMLRENGFCGLTVYLENFDEVVNECTDRGFDLVMPVRPSMAEPESGRRACMFRDADGNYLELISQATQPEPGAGPTGDGR